MLLRVALLKYISVASDRQVVNSVIAQNYVFFPFSGKVIAEKCFLKKGEKKKSICYSVLFQEYIFTFATPEITGNQVKS